MRSSDTITLFSRPPRRESGPSAFVVSSVMHGCIFAVLLASMHHVRVVERLASHNYAVRLMNVRETTAKLYWSPQNKIFHTGRAGTKSAFYPTAKAGTSGAARLARLSQNYLTPKPAPQTLIQPEVPQDQRVLPTLPIPQATVWTAGEIEHKKIVPPKPTPPGAIQVRPSLRPPNRELNPAEISLSSIPMETAAPMPVPGTTIPVKVDGPTPAKQLRQTESPDTADPTAARVLALSKNKLEVGTAALPVANEIAQSDIEGSPTLAEEGSVEQGASGKMDAGHGLSGVGHGAGGASGNGNGFTIHDGSGNAGPGTGFSIAGNQGGPPDLGAPGVEHITQPKNGQYGMVVVGASPEEDYPETAELWTGRMVYTVYLQTDTSQNWILQYSSPRSSEQGEEGSTRLDAPWPYDMMRPNLNGSRDDVLVHGFVNTAGHFEQLSVAYPPAFGKAQMLLKELNRWAFRPAMSQGQPAMVEVLLIIPGAMD